MSDYQLHIGGNGKVYDEDNRYIGFVYIDVGRRYNTDLLIKHIPFELDLKQKKYIRGLKLPKRFDFAYIHKIIVKPRFRGKGYGGAIMQELKKQARKPVVIILEAAQITYGKSNIRNLKKFYRKQGFRMFEDQQGDIMGILYLKS